jgi:PQQ-like domain
MKRRVTSWAVLAVALAAACSFFSPETGVLTNPTVCGGGGQSEGAYGVTTTSTSACGEAGVVSDAASNFVVADAGVMGNVVIADQLNNRVVVVDRSGNLLWWFGNGSSVPGPSSVVGPNDVEVLPNGLVLIAGTGAPSGSEPTCDGDAGCVDDRVLMVDVATHSIKWQFGGHDGGPGANKLSGPASAVLVPADGGNHVLVSNQGMGAVVEIDMTTNAIIWQFPPLGDAGGQTCSPQSAERLASGNTLIADQAGNRILEVTQDGGVVWQYPAVVDTATLDFPAFASRLPNGNTLIADSNNGRVLEIDDAGAVAWSYVTTNGTPPTGAVRLDGGHTLITEINEGLVLEVDHDSPAHVLYTHGRAGVAGVAPDDLNQPYNAKVLGDFTGLTYPGPGAVTTP